MDGSVAEGISTSLQTCPPGPHGRSASQDLPPFPSVPVHVNDLGLTPPPGSQQLQQRNATQGSSQDEARDMSAADAEKSISVACPDFSTEAEDTSFPSDICPVGYSGSSDLVDGFLDGFDPEVALRELHAALDSRKRTGDEAFEGVDFWNPPEKKRLFDFTQATAGSPPGDTPSLSSPDSLLRPEQMESAPHTPAATGNCVSPNSLFDSLDALFEDPQFQMPLELPDADQVEHLDFDIPTASDLDIPNGTNDALDQMSPDESINTEGPPANPPMSELTKERFCLSADDILSSTTREALKIRTEPQYTTPYPVYGGPLGYFPSTPGIHVKCVEVIDEEVHNRMHGLKDKVQQLTYERNKYRTAWNQWTTRDQATGKSKEQLLREENTRLRRSTSHLQSKVDQYKNEAAEWKSQLSHLSVIYNNLLYDINIRRQTPAVAPIPQGYQPTTGSQGHTYAPQHSLPAPVGPSQPVVAPAAPAHAGAPSGSVTTPSVPPPAQAGPNQGVPKPAPVMIDLTDESNEQSNDPQPSSESESRGANMIQSLRNKRYDWLEQPGQTGTVSAPSSPAHHQAPSPPDRSRSHPPNLSDEELARAMEQELATT